ncbi:MAG TPA: MarR family transcriptional regulator [Pilimelia sp.]|nr:MarR family transcriptional regulator [Pilimelia sp.]
MSQPGRNTDPLVDAFVGAVPQIDPTVEGVVERIHLIGRYLDTLRNQITAPHQLTPRDYDILARLFWTGPPHRLTPTQLAAGTASPPATITSRLDRLERRGLIDRSPDPGDRRSLLAQLTPAGAGMFRQIVAEQARHEAKLFSDLAAEDLVRLRDLLEAVMASCQRDLGRPKRRVSLALGTAAPHGDDADGPDAADAG